MEFSAEHDIRAPIDFVYAQITDFAALETYIMSAGAFVERTDELDEFGPGLCWWIEGNLRGKQRVIDIELKEVTEQEALVYELRSKDLTTQMLIDVISLDRTTTRLSCRIQPEAHSISARLILQSARLAQKTLEKRLKKRLNTYGDSLEERYILA